MHSALSKSFKILLSVFFIFLLAMPSFAKSKKKKKTVALQTYVENEEDEAVEGAEEEWQLLEWDEKDPSWVYRYDVIIEEYNTPKDEWSEVRRLETEGNESQVQIKPFLYPGHYRYKIITYDLFGIPSVESDWTEFNVYKAFKPEVKSLGVQLYFGNVIYLDELNDGVINISGKNLFDLQEDENDVNYTQYVLINQSGRSDYETKPVDIEHDDNNQKVNLTFNLRTIDPGTYNLVARDASGLESEKNSRNELTIKFKKAVDLDVSGGYAFPVVLFDQTIPDYFDSRVFPLSVHGKVNFMFVKHLWGYLGIGLSAYYTRMFYICDDYTIDGNVLNFFGSVVFQKPLYAHPDDPDKRRHMATLEARAGFGHVNFIDYRFHFPHNINSDSFSSFIPGLDLGGSFQWYFTNRLYMDIGLDFQVGLGSELFYGAVIPTLSIGWQF